MPAANLERGKDADEFGESVKHASAIVQDERMKCKLSGERGGSRVPYSAMQ